MKRLGINESSVLGDCRNLEILELVFIYKMKGIIQAINILLLSLIFIIFSNTELHYQQQLLNINNSM